MGRAPAIASAGLVLVCAMLAGCGGSDAPSAPAPRIERADLAAMVVPRDDLGPEALALARGDGSGRVDNRRAAGLTPDPRDSGRALRDRGRVDGYALAYERRGASDTGPSSMVEVGTDVSLFRDEASAAAHLARTLGAYRRFRGRRVDGRRIASSDRFDVDDLGSGAGGIHVRLRGGAPRFATLVGFRRGRVVASASASSARDLELSRDVQAIALKLRDRIDGVASGAVTQAKAELRERRAARKGPNPRRFTLRDSDLGVRAMLRHQGPVRTARMRAYWREYRITRGRLGGSRPRGLRTMAQVYPTAGRASREQRYVASEDGAASIARGYADGRFAPPGIRGDVKARGRRSGDSAWTRFSFDVTDGRAEAVLVTVRRERVVAGALVWGLARRVRERDVLALRDELRGGLRR